MTQQPSRVSVYYWRGRPNLSGAHATIVAMQPSESQWAWLAGLFEGEGSIKFQGANQVALVVAMVDRDVVDAIDALIPSPSGVKVWRKPKLGRSDVYAWSISSRDTVAWALKNLLPWLHSRRAAKAHEALHRLEGNSGANALRTHCKRGHEFTEANTYTPSGTTSRACRACREEMYQRAVAAQRPTRAYAFSPEHRAKIGAAQRAYQQRKREERASG